MWEAWRWSRTAVVGVCTVHTHYCVLTRKLLYRLYTVWTQCTFCFPFKWCSITYTCIATDTNSLVHNIIIMNAIIISMFFSQVKWASYTKLTANDLTVHNYCIIILALQISMFMATSHCKTIMSRFMITSRISLTPLFMSYSVLLTQ